MKKTGWWSINRRMGGLALLLVLLLCSTILLSGYAVYRRNIEEHYAMLGANIARTVASFIEGERLALYLRTGEADERYFAVQASLCAVTDCREVTQVRVVVPDAAGAHHVFASGTGASPALGAYMAWGAQTDGRAARFAAGEQVDPWTEEGPEGTVMSVYQPIEAAGGVAGYVGVEMALGYLEADWHRLLATQVGFTLASAALFMVLLMLTLRGSVTRPVCQMAHAADDFLSGAPRRGMSSIEALDIRTGDELEALATALKAMEKRTREYIINLGAATQRAETDALTGLYNREAFEQKTGFLLRATWGEGTIHAFFAIDVDFFKQVNDRFGHLEGDRVLQRCASALRQIFRSADILARMGGDEFAVFCANTGSMEVVGRKARQLCACWRGIRLPDGSPLAASVGVAVAPVAGQDYETLYRRADEAMYRAKAAGRDGFVIAG